MYSYTYRRFGCTEVHRERNTVEDPFWHIGPVSYRRMNSSSSEKKKRSSQLISPVFTCATFWQFTVSSECTKTSRTAVLASDRNHSQVHSSSSPKSAPVGSGLSTLRHVGKFLQSPIANITDAPRHSGYRWFPSPPPPPPPAVRPHSADTSPGLTAGKRVHPRAGQVERRKVEMGFSQRWVAARCSAEQPLLSTPLPWEKLTG